MHYIVLSLLRANVYRTVLNLTPLLRVAEYDL